MSNPIPQQLQVPAFKFFLAGRNRKTPIERCWNTSNSLMFFEPKLKNHLLKNGNIGICTGYGQLIVIDFDDEKYQKMKEPLLPKTFTVRTAGKGLHHLYYVLKGETMIAKIGIGMDNRLCDIQAGKCGVICPPSKRDGKFYSVVEDIPIAEIDCTTLSNVFGIKQYKESRKRTFKDEANPKKMQDTIDILKKLGVPRKSEHQFRCPFHKSNSEKSLYVFEQGTLYCFHCMRHWSSGNDFKAFFEEINGGINIII